MTLRILPGDNVAHRYYTVYNNKDKHAPPERGETQAGGTMACHQLVVESFVMTQPLSYDKPEMHLWIYRPGGTCEGRVLAWEQFTAFFQEELTRLDETPLQSRAIGDTEPLHDNPQTQME